MWKEKYETLVADLRKQGLTLTIDASGEIADIRFDRSRLHDDAATAGNGKGVSESSTSSTSSTSSASDLVSWLKSQPEVIHLMRTTPPHVVVHGRRANVTLAEDHIHSKIGTLVIEGFFDAARPLEEVAIECKRRGFIPPTTKNAGFLSPRFKELVEMGVLTAEVNGYRKAPGVQIEFTALP